MDDDIDVCDSGDDIYTIDEPSEPTNEDGSAQDDYGDAQEAW
jgi:hypothetical protein